MTLLTLKSSQLAYLELPLPSFSYHPNSISMILTCGTVLVSLSNGRFHPSYVALQSIWQLFVMHLRDSIRATRDHVSLFLYIILMQ